MVPPYKNCGNFIGNADGFILAGVQILFDSFPSNFRKKNRLSGIAGLISDDQIPSPSLAGKTVIP